MSELSLPKEYIRHPIVALLEKREYRFLADEEHANAIGDAINVFIEFQEAEIERRRKQLKNTEITPENFRFRMIKATMASNRILDIWRDAFDYGISDRDGHYTDTLEAVTSRLKSMLSDYEDVNVRYAGDLRPLPRILRVIIGDAPTLWIQPHGHRDIELILLAALGERMYKDPHVAACDQLERRGFEFDSGNLEHCRMLEEDADRIAKDQEETRDSVRRAADHLEAIMKAA